MNPKITKPLFMLFTFLLLNLTWLSAQENGSEQTISGVVIDPDGETLIGVNIYAENSTNGTATDIDGA